VRRLEPLPSVLPAVACSSSGDAGRSLRIRNAATGKTTTFKPDHDGGDVRDRSRDDLYRFAVKRCRRWTDLSTIRTPEKRVLRHRQRFIQRRYGDIHRSDVRPVRRRTPRRIGGRRCDDRRESVRDQLRVGVRSGRSDGDDHSRRGSRRNWLVEFEIENDLSGDTRAISHEDSDDVFEIPLDELHVEDGEYEWELVIYNGPNSSNEDIAIRLPGGTSNSSLSGRSMRIPAMIPVLPNRPVARQFRIGR